MSRLNYEHCHEKTQFYCMRTTFICFCLSHFWRTDGQGEANKAYNEEDWMELEALNAYGKSKTMAEKAAWEYVKELPGITSLSLLRGGFNM